MKILAHVAIIAALLCSPALAQNSSTSASLSQSGANVIMNSTGIQQAPGVGSPGLAVSVGTCMGSSSGGISAPGFGISFGGTQVDSSCNARADAALLAQMGQNVAALMRLCAQPDNARALASAGTPCPAQYYQAQTQRRTLFGSSQPTAVATALSVDELPVFSAAQVKELLAAPPSRRYNASTNRWE